MQKPKIRSVITDRLQDGSNSEIFLKDFGKFLFDKTLYQIII